MEILNLPAEVQENFYWCGHIKISPWQEVELSNSPRLIRLQILQVKATYEIVITPDVFRHKVHLKKTKNK